MAISELHASHIRRVKVGFVASGMDLKPSALTAAAGVSPDKAARRGDVRRNAAGAVVGEECEGWWRVDSVPHVASKDINEHFTNCETYFDVLWESTYLYAGTGPVLSSRSCSGIGSLHAGLGFDIYQIDEDD